MYNSMIEIETKTKKWGNSIGIVIPKEKITLKPEQKVRILIEGSGVTKVKDIFGVLKFKKPIKQLMKEVDEDLDIAF